MGKTPQTRNSAENYQIANDGTKRTNVSKREIWESFDSDTQEFISAWPKGSIVAVENITRGLVWKK